MASGSLNKKQSSMKASQILSSKDMMNKKGSALFTPGSTDFNQPAGGINSTMVDTNHMFTTPPKPTNVPLSQGGFFHRNQVVGYTDSGLDDSMNL